MSKGTALVRRIRQDVLSPRDVTEIRSRIKSSLSQHINSADKVLTGSIKWDANQVKIFQILMNKVVPDIHASVAEVSVTNRNIHELSVDQLQEIAASPIPSGDG